jgi:glycosyltransferase involved in cell wall biosynthesis
MKLLYITNGVTGVGGLERVLSLKASWLAERLGYEVHIVSLDEEGRTRFYPFSDKITFHTVATGGSPWRYVTGLRRVVRQVRPDVISVCDDGLKGFFVPLWIGLRCRQGGRKRTSIIYERHVSKQQISPRFGSLMNLGARLYDRFVVLTSDNQSQWPGRNVRVVANPLSFYAPDPSPLDRRRVIVVGKVTHQKGQDLLLAAWRSIKHRHPDWRIDIFGAQTDGGELARATVDEPNFVINQPTRDIEREYLSSAICALPSRYEGFGMTLIEAMACGVPCVAFDCPCGPRDIIRDGEDGILVPPGDVDSFARALSRLMTDHDLRHKMAAAARRNVTRYDIDTIAARWDELFHEIAGRER